MEQSEAREFLWHTAVELVVAEVNLVEYRRRLTLAESLGHYCELPIQLVVLQMCKLKLGLLKDGWQDLNLQAQTRLCKPRVFCT